MNKLISILFSLIFVICLFDTAFALPNPSAVYCEKLGYEFKVIKNPDGSESGVCVISPGVEFDAWAFFMGEVGSEYSYCAKYGYDTQNDVIYKDDRAIKCAVCVSESTTTDDGRGKTTSAEEKRIPMLDLMEQNGEPLIDTTLYQMPEENTEEETIPQEKTITIEQGNPKEYSPAGALPSSFDWRNYNGGNWMTPVKNQGSCGSCWAFSAVGAVEAKVNIDANNPGLDYDLSEQQLVSCGAGGGCLGGDPGNALKYIRDNGITNENYLPYTAIDSGGCNSSWCGLTPTPCSGTVENWQDEVVKITNYHQVTITTGDRKQALMSYGPLSTILNIASMYYVYDGVEYYIGGNGLHGVVLVGWNDAENAWIIKNSWGSGTGNDGYWKIHYGYINENLFAVDQTIRPSVPQSFHFSSTNYPVGEDVGNATITVLRTWGSDGEVTVNYIASNGSAEAGEDYTATSGTLTFAPGETEKTFTVSIINDTEPEEDETIELTLSNPVGGNAILRSPTTAIITILDDDISIIQFLKSDYFVDEEAGNAEITVTRSRNTDEAVTVHYSTSGGTAVNNADYTYTEGTLIFDIDETMRTFNIPIINNPDPEAGKTIELILDNPTGVGAFLGSPSTAILTIMSGSGVLQFLSPTYTVNETAGIAVITVTRTESQTGAIRVNYSTSNGTAIAGEDYTNTSGTLIFAKDEASKTFTVSINDDDIYEGDKTINLTLSNPAPEGAVLGSQLSTAILTIRDSECQVYFSSSTYTVDEYAGTATITVNRTNKTDNPVMVNYATTNGTAIAGQDYTATSGTLIFTKDEMQKSFTVTIIDDTNPEANETINLTLSNPADGAILVTPAEAILTILDNEGGTLQFDIPPSKKISETAESDYFLVLRTGKTGGTITVDYEIGGTATFGEDYTAAITTIEEGITITVNIPTSGTLTFADGEIEKAFFVYLIDDDIYEGDETVNITLSNPAPEGAVLESQSTAILTIRDSECQVYFSSSAYKVNESAGTATITVNRIGGTVGTASVHYSTSDKTAESDTDYIHTEDTLTFASGQTSKTFTIPIINDTDVESNETINLTLSNPAPEGTILGSPSTAVLTILDNDGGTFQFSSSTYSVNETAGTATITVTRTVKTDGTVSVHYSTSDGTAESDTDYIHTEDTLTFASGQTSKTFTIPITNDTDVESNETINLTLSNVTGGAILGSPSTAVLTIVNNDKQFIDSGIALTGVQYSSLAWGDYDNDGDLDLALCGSGITKIYRNNGNNTFTDIGVGLPGVSRGSLAWGDYDNDGDLDLALCGSGITKIYRNNGNNTFTDIGVGLPGVSGGSLAWGDYDNDGNIDLAVKGIIYRNNGDGTFTNINAGLSGVNDGSLAWGDYDNDGDLDLALCGSSITKIYRNNGNNTFTDTVAGLIGVSDASLAWGDYDNDGDLDLALCGFSNKKGDITKIYRNNGDGTFTDIVSGLSGIYDGSLAWGDYDNDGNLDLAVCGWSWTEDSQISRVYRNNGNNTFTNIGAALSGVQNGSSVAWGDYDNDGNIDLAVCGYSGRTAITKIYRNVGNRNPNTIPTSPTNLTYEQDIADTSIILKWSFGSDTQTPDSGLYYNLRVGTVSGASDIVSGVYGSPLLGNYLRPKVTPAQLGVRLKALPIGTYYWSVQTIDTGLRTSAWSQESTFTVIVPAYTISGYVTLTGGISAISDITLSLTGALTDTINPDTIGNYSFPELTSGGNYTITSSLQDYHFFPSSRLYSLLDSDQTEQNFTGLHKDYDSDVDGLPDWWEWTHFGEGNLEQGADDDPDGDGYSNLEEYTYNTDPNDADSKPFSSISGRVSLKGVGNSTVWVKVPEISSTDTTIVYMYYGNPAAEDIQQDTVSVWDENYKGVWHMNAPSWLDSTYNANNGTSFGDVTTTPIGKLNNAGTFDGNGDYINGIGEVPGVSNRLTLSLWFKVNDYLTNFRTLAGEGVPHNVSSLGAYSISVYKPDNDLYLIYGSVNDENYSSQSAGDRIPSSEAFDWHYAVWTIDSTTVKLYLDGTQVATQPWSGGNINSGKSFVIGATDTSAQYFSFAGIIDEVRVSDIARSPAWIKASYYSENDELITYGEQENISGEYKYRRALYIDPNGKIDQNLTDFPLCIKLDTSRITYNGSGGKDIRFTDSEGEPLSYEIEDWNEASASDISDVSLTLVGALTDTINSDTDGTYSFTGLERGLYMLTPSLQDYRFLPSYRLYPYLETDQNEQDFIGFYKTYDSDTDTLSDWWELEHFDNLGQTANDDPDIDGYTNIEEYLNNTDPNDPESRPLAHAIEVSSCQTLNQPNIIYYLTKDISGSDVCSKCINITAEGITFDGLGYSIINPHLEDAVIYSQADNVTIKNCVLTASGSTDANGSGIYSIGDDCLIENNTVTDTFWGIRTSGENTVIQNNVLERNVKAIHLGGNNNTVKNNLLKNNIKQPGWGIGIWIGYYNQLINNKVYGSRQGVVLYDADYTLLKCNQISENTAQDIYYYSNTQNVTIDNNCTDTSIDCIWQGDQCQCAP